MAKNTRKATKAPKAPKAKKATKAKKSVKASKTKKVTPKGKRTLSPALQAWNDKVMAKYREMKITNPNTKLGDAMKAAKKD